MCIIAYGLKRDFRTGELGNCLRHNPHGNFLAVIRTSGDGSRTVRRLRALEARPVLDLFGQASGDDEILFHAREASGSPVALSNVHGWESPDGLAFCHNGVLPYFEGCDDQSDSKIFFDRIFLPAWRGEGKRFTKNVELLLGYFSSLHYVEKNTTRTNKFAFLLPEGTVRLYGDFIRDHGICFSNDGYRDDDPETESKEKAS